MIGFRIFQNFYTSKSPKALLLTLYALASCALLGSLASCKRTNQSSDHMVLGNVQEGDDYLWPNATAEVCWEKNLAPKDHDEFSSQREKIATFVTEQMGRAGFTLKGWKECQKESRGIRIKQVLDLLVSDSGIKFPGEVVGFGKKLDGIPEGLILAIKPEAYKVLCSRIEDCVLTTALHEMGHAIGLRHEQSRADSGCDLDQRAYGDANFGGLAVGPHDPESIMNYCATNISDSVGRLHTLSQGDIRTIRYLYGGKNPDFPKQTACEKDGNTWSTFNLLACCTLSPGQKSSDKAIYPVCPEAGKTQESSPPETPKSPESKKNPEPKYAPWKQNALVWIKASEPFAVEKSLIYCREGVFQGMINRAEEWNFIFGINQTTKTNSDTFMCDRIEIYPKKELQDSDKSNSKTMARLVFKSPITIKKDGLVKLDLSPEKWTFHDPSEREDSPTAGKPSTASDPQQIKDGPIVETVQKIAFMVDQDQVLLKGIGGRLVCAAKTYEGLGSLDQEIQLSSGFGKTSLAFYFKVPFGETCNALVLKLERKMLSGTTSNPTIGIEEFINIQVDFDKPLFLPGNNKIMIKKFTPPACILDPGQKAVPDSLR